MKRESEATSNCGEKVTPSVMQRHVITLFPSFFPRFANCAMFIFEQYVIVAAGIKWWVKIDKVNAFSINMFTQNKEVIAIKQGVFGDRFHTAAPVSIKLPGQYNIIGYTLLMVCSTPSPPIWFLK